MAKSDTFNYRNKDNTAGLFQIDKSNWAVVVRNQEMFSIIRDIEFIKRSTPNAKGIDCFYIQYRILARKRHFFARKLEIKL